MKNLLFSFFTSLILLSFTFQSCKMNGGAPSEMNTLSGLLNNEVWIGVAKIKESWKRDGNISVGFTMGEEDNYNQIFYINSIEKKLDVEQKLRSPQGCKEFCTSFTTIHPKYRSGDYYELDEYDDFPDYVKITKYDSETQEIEGTIQASFSRYTGHPKKDKLDDHLVFKDGRFRATIKNKK